jgi:hypothetical protein
MSTRWLPMSVALAVWSLLVWTTRIRNIWTDAELTTGEQWLRTALALSFTVLALAVGHALYHRTSWRSAVVWALSIWTMTVWVVRSIGIAAADHSGAFIAVHLVLAVISIGMAALALREVIKLTERTTSTVADGV